MAEPAGRVLGFVGVSTAGSSIQRVFPAWAEDLGLSGMRLAGHDLPLDASAEDYRAVVRLIRDDDAYAGALITTHKISLYRAAADLFDSIDPFAELCGEISSISKRGGRLAGQAKDPFTAGLALEEFLDDDHFARTGGQALILGSGGAGTAIAYYLAKRPDRPGRILCTGLGAADTGHVRAVLAAGGAAPGLVETAVADGPADGLLAAMPPGSLVVNATGMGKDRPGSPLGDAAPYPPDAIAWELNYRGELAFLHQARAAGVRVVDGWRYFVHGWSQVVAEVFGLSLTDADMARLSASAEAVR
ncbi:shikimate dehydrogenase family protein [Allonocardiopsis opalescens]|uniref:Shikimate 5-dehydrogenase n=1 Tax=Allonocardiopsis opalescens TaxID=1144618 RepID=A0A2T0Q0R0_9ACTN|nr:shikimate dehydrogenase [Allonocardiopsis opalescens]PRX97263.1 shikimate 5-dehydrogenase [Allonocardiopsis opalescens]